MKRHEQATHNTNTQKKMEVKHNSDVIAMNESLQTNALTLSAVKNPEKWGPCAHVIYTGNCHPVQSFCG